MQICEVCGTTRVSCLMTHSGGEVKIDGVTTLELSEHTVCSEECANVLYFCAIYGYQLHDYIWLQ